MKKSLLLLGFISYFSFGQVTDQNNKSAVDVNGDALSGSISISNLKVNSIDFIGNSGEIRDLDGFRLFSTYIYNNLKTIQIGVDEGPNTDIQFMTPLVYDALRVKNNGNVGIGTNNPISLLAIGGNGESGSLSVEGDNGGAHIVNFRDDVGNNLFQVNGNADDDTYEITFGDLDEVSSLNNMFVLKNDKSYFLNGNVGIGTINPDEKLSVNGTIHAKEVRVDLIGWPDYVFDENYDLPSLKDVEKYIKENGHLENIQSAGEVEENGILLGEMNKKLLEKIEELTLYLIQQNKDIDELKKQVEYLMQKQ